MPRRTVPPPPPPGPLCKHHSWSPDVIRNEAWQRRKNVAAGSRGSPTTSVTEDDLEELRACMELGFRFDSPEIDPKLSDTFPALELYQAVNRRYKRSLSRSPSMSSVASSVSDNDSDCSSSIYDSGDAPEKVKARLKQWAQVVACSVRHSSPSRSFCSIQIN